MQATLLGEKSRTVHPQIAQQCVEVEKHRLGGQRQWTIDDPTILYLVLLTNKRKLRRDILAFVCSGQWLIQID